MTRFVPYCLLVVLLTSGGCSEESDMTDCDAQCLTLGEQQPETGPVNGCATIDGQPLCVRLCMQDDDCNPQIFPGGCAAVDDKGEKYCAY